MRKVVVFVFLVLMSSCQEKPKNAVSFYFWKTKFLLSSEEEKVLSENNVKKLYVRYFDVALQNNLAFPVAPIKFEKKIIKQEIIPTIFIKNEVFFIKKYRCEAALF